MGRKALTLEKQIELLQSRGMIITDVEKAKEVLLDVGYYRLGFYASTALSTPSAWASAG